MICPECNGGKRVTFFSCGLPNGVITCPECQGSGVVDKDSEDFNLKKYMKLVDEHSKANEEIIANLEKQLENRDKMIKVLEKQIKMQDGFLTAAHFRIEELENESGMGRLTNFSKRRPSEGEPE